MVLGRALDREPHLGATLDECHVLVAVADDDGEGLDVFASTPTPRSARSARAPSAAAPRSTGAAAASARDDVARGARLRAA